MPRLLAAAAFGLAVEAQRRSLDAAATVVSRFGPPLGILTRPAVAVARGSVAVGRHHLGLDGWAARGLAEQRRAQALAVKAVRGLIAALVAAVLDEVDLDQVVARVDLDRIVDRINLNQIAARIDLDQIVDRVDIDAIADRIDLDAIADRIDLDAIVGRVDIDAILARSTSCTHRAGHRRGRPRRDHPRVEQHHGQRDRGRSAGAGHAHRRSGQPACRPRPAPGEPATDRPPPR